MYSIDEQERETPIFAFRSPAHRQADKEMKTRMAWYWTCLFAPMLRPLATFSIFKYKTIFANFFFARCGWTKLALTKVFCPENNQCSGGGCRLLPLSFSQAWLGGSIGERSYFDPRSCFLLRKEMGNEKESSPWNILKGITLSNRSLQENACFRCLSSFFVSQLDSATTLVFDPIMQWGLTMQWFCSGENMSYGNIRPKS